MPIAFSTYAYGDPGVLARMVTDYRCGHCTGQVEELRTNDATGQLHATIRHNDGCPVLRGAVSQAPDMIRAAGIPATFRP
ncbi:MAG: hypothetical protein HOY79_46105 [Streptomyces sp.]|nr:hypothetical protein [Streptomyces sp.]